MSTFQSLIIIYSRGTFLCIIIGDVHCTLIYRPLSYPFRSLSHCNVNYIDALKVLKTLETFYENFRDFFKSLGIFKKKFGDFYETLGTFLKSLGNFIKTLGTFINTLGTFIQTLGTFKNFGVFLKTLGTEGVLF